MTISAQSVQSDTYYSGNIYKNIFVAFTPNASRNSAPYKHFYPLNLNISVL